MAHSLARPPSPPHAQIAALQARNDALHQALIVREALARTTAHDLRTPLNAMSGLVHLMRLKFASDLPDKALEYLDYMSRAVQQMDTLSGDFMEQMGTASVVHHPERVNLRTAVDAALSEMNAHMQTCGAQVTISGASGEILADTTLLRMLLVHLLRNAAQCRHPTRALGIDIALNATNGFRIRDNGMGFDPREGDAIFLPFRKTADGIKGTGIGLATCRTICKRHGWRITAQSDGSSGACFEVEFCPPDTPDS